MTELLLLSMSLSSPPAEIPISIRADMAVKQATARIMANTPVGRTPTSSLLVPSQYPTPTTKTLTQSTGVFSQSFFVKAPHGEGQTTGITQGTPVQTVGIHPTQPTLLGGMQVGVTRTHAPSVVLRGNTKSNNGCTTG